MKHVFLPLLLPLYAYQWYMFKASYWNLYQITVLKTSAACLAVWSLKQQLISGWCHWQETAGNKMKGFKLLLQAAEAGDRSSMITVAKAFDTGVDLSADKSVETV